MGGRRASGRSTFSSGWCDQPGLKVSAGLGFKPLNLVLFCCVFISFIFYFVFYFNFKEVSVHIFYATIYTLHVDAYEYTISNKFEISNKKNSRGIYNIQSRVTIYNFKQVSIYNLRH